MKRLNFALLASFASGARAVAPRVDSSWKGPQETAAIEPLGYFANAEHAPTPTAAPEWFAWMNKDLKRSALVGDNTCGFFSDGDPFSCDPDYTCTNSGNYRDCCRGSCGTTVFPTVCLDATEAACITNTDRATLCCTYSAQYPYCITYLWATSVMPTKVFTLFNCDQSQFSHWTYILQAEPQTTSSSTIRTTSSTSSSTKSTSSSTSSSSSSASTTFVTITPSASSNSDSGSSTPVGAIVGGVVGGLAVIGLIALGVFFILRKTKQKNAAAPPAAPAVAQAQYPPQPPSTGGGHVGMAPAPAYNPHHSVAYTTGTSPTVPAYPSPTSSSGPFPSPTYGSSEQTKLMGGQAQPAVADPAVMRNNVEYPEPQLQQPTQVQQPQPTQYTNWNYYHQGQS